MHGQTSSYVLTTLVIAPSSSNLTTLEAVRDELALGENDTGNDNWFSKRAIPQASADIARYCNRVFGLATWRDEFRPQRGIWGEGTRNRNNPLMLTKFPVNANIVTFTGNTHSTDVIDGVSPSIDQSFQGALVSGPGIPVGTTIAFGFGTSVRLSQAATETSSDVKFSTGISVAETVSGVSKGLTAGVDFDVEVGALTAGDEGAGRVYRIDHHGSPRTWPDSKIIVVYQSGYSLPDDDDPNLPDDLQECCIRLVTARFRAKGRDPLLVERSQPNIGTERYWVGGSPGQRSTLPPDLEAIASNYRVPVVA